MSCRHQFIFNEEKLVKQGGPAPADAATTPPEGDLQHRLQDEAALLFRSPPPFYFFFSLLLEAFLHLGSVMGLPALSLQSLSPLKAFLSSLFPPASPIAAGTPLALAPAALILYGQKLTLAQVSFDQREPYPVPETSASRGDGRN